MKRLTKAVKKHETHIIPAQFFMERCSFVQNKDDRTYHKSREYVPEMKAHHEVIHGNNLQDWVHNRSKIDRVMSNECMSFERKNPEV